MNCQECGTEMEWVDGYSGQGEIRLECPKCHWTTCTGNANELKHYCSRIDGGGRAQC